MEARAWQQRFNALEDGRVTRRVIDIVFAMDKSSGNKTTAPFPKIKRVVQISLHLSRTTLQRVRRRLSKLVRPVLVTGPIPWFFYALVMRPLWWLQFKTKRRDPSLPKVSIIIPVYNVEQFVADCVRSARAQRWPNLDIIAVNDGSTDSSLAILRQLQVGTPELRVQTQENRGLGAARNAGIELIADSDYLMFLDSDDTLPMGAVASLVQTAQSSASPLVVGRTNRFEGVRYYERRDTACLHRKTRTAVTVNDEPLILSDVICCNKLYSLSFWRANQLRFPEGVRYEDAALVVRACLAAKRFDLLAAPVYNWRLRGNGESLSNLRTETKSLVDRLLSIEQIIALLQREVALKRLSPAVLRYYWTRVISVDLQLFVPSIPKANAEFFHIFQMRGLALLAEVDEKIWATATGKHKEAVRFALSNTRENTIAFLKQEKARRRESKSGSVWS